MYIYIILYYILISLIPLSHSISIFVLDVWLHHIDSRRPEFRAEPGRSPAGARQGETLGETAAEFHQKARPQGATLVATKAQT